MQVSFDDETISRSRESFIMGNEVSKDNVREEIFESWIRSKKAGVNPNTTILEIPKAEEAFKIWKRDFSYNFYAIKPYISHFNAELEELDSAIFYLDNNLMIFRQLGSKKLLNQLDSKNIALGANFQENSIGTNAAALALSTQRDAYTIGHEHYIEALHEYGCVATRYFSDQETVKGYIMYICPKDNFNYSYKGLISQWSQLLSAAVKLNQHKKALSLAYEYINLGKEQNEKSILFVDNRGYVIDCNDCFASVFGMEISRIKGSPFVNTFPELKAAINCLKTDKPIFFQEVFVDRIQENKIYYMECQSVKKNESNIGMILSLYDKKPMLKKIAHVANYTAHFCFNDLIGTSPNFLSIMNTAKKSANNSSSVMILGESGTGKDLFAQAIHNASTRAHGPFISVNCSAIPRELIGSELFGYMEGAFTGARRGGAPGKFELADKGTIFLDEIGDMPLNMQAALLRILEEKVVTRLGGHNPIPIDIKVIAATNRDLLKSVALNEFRLDLYYRLNVIKIEIPPLRDRRGDIPLLVEYFIKQFNSSFHKNIVKVTPEAMNLLKSYDWPGNVRELRNVIERAINQAESSFLSINDLPKEILVSHFSSENKHSDDQKLFDNKHFDNYDQKLIKKVNQQIDEKNKIAELMQKFNGNKVRVAKELGITRATLYRRLAAMEKDL